MIVVTARKCCSPSAAHRNGPTHMAKGQRRLIVLAGAVAVKLCPRIEASGLWHTNSSVLWWELFFPKLSCWSQEPDQQRDWVLICLPVVYTGQN